MYSTAHLYCTPTAQHTYSTSHLQHNVYSYSTAHIQHSTAHLQQNSPTAQQTYNTARHSTHTTQYTSSPQLHKAAVDVELIVCNSCSVSQLCRSFIWQYRKGYTSTEDIGYTQGTTNMGCACRVHRLRLASCFHVAEIKPKYATVVCRVC